LADESGSAGHIIGIGDGATEPRKAFDTLLGESGITALVVGGFSEYDAYYEVPQQVTDVMVTPGPKGITAGLLRFAHYTDARVHHLGLDGRHHVLSEPSPRRPLVRPDWPESPRERYTTRPDSDRPQGLARLAEHLAVTYPDCTLWWRRSGTPTQLSELLVGLVITGPHGSCSVHLLPRGPKAHEVPRGPEDHELPHASTTAELLRKHVRDFRTRVLTSSAGLTNLVGPAHRPLVVLHIQRGDTALDDPVGATDVDRLDRAWEQFARAERWLPLG